MFGLTDGPMRLNGIDTIYGGAGTPDRPRRPRATSSANGHAHDADAILGDNGNLYRIVGAFGSPFVDAYGGSKPPVVVPRLRLRQLHATASASSPRAWATARLHAGA